LNGEKDRRWFEGINNQTIKQSNNQGINIV